MNPEPIRLPVPGGPLPFRSRGPRVIRFIERYCVHGEGDWFGKPFVLRPWQKRIINRLFELRWDDRTQRWRRRYRRALIGLPSGSGKTELAAALGLYMLVGGEHVSPLIPVAAASKEQANLVFGAAKIMAEESSRLRAILETGVESITLRGAPGRMYRVAAAEGTNDGQRPSCTIFDELHEWSEARNTYSILTKGTAKRVDSLQIAITTAGHDLDTICGRLYTKGRQIEESGIEDPRFFFHWVEAPEDAPYDDPETWRSYHPAADDFISVEELEGKLEELPEALFRRYFLNQWTPTESSWLPDGAWAALEVSDEDAAFDPGGPLYLGWDAATKHDSTAVVAAQVKEIEAALPDGTLQTQRRLVVQSWVWERPIDARTARPVRDWLLPIEEVREVIHDLAEDYDVRAIAFDQTFVTWESKEMAEGGLPMVEFPQHSERMAVASQLLYELIIQGVVAHDGDPVLARHVKSAVAKQSRTGRAAWRLVKGASKAKMDAAIALAMAVWAAYHTPGPEAPPPKPVMYVPGDEDE